MAVNRIAAMTISIRRGEKGAPSSHRYVAAEECRSLLWRIRLAVGAGCR
jgi:hypothetical protein